MTHPKRVDQYFVTKPTKFFEKELVGEEPPSFATMQMLYGLATELFRRHPWELLAEDELVLVEGAAPKDLCFSRSLTA